MRHLLRFAKPAHGLRWAIAPLAALALLWPVPAPACSYSQEPEPVGHASAEFFAARMAPQATFIDVAVAESTAPAFGAAKGWTAPATTFRVIYRLKGQSPDRFSLYLGELPPGEAVPEARHFVNEDGRVEPFPYPHETSLTMPTSMSSCDPGMLRVRLGQTYVIFREADGRLLDRVPLYDDRQARLFPIMPVSLDESIGWLQASMTPAIVREPSDKRPAPHVAAVGFDKGLTQDEALQWVRRASVQPIAVLIARGEVVEETRVPVERATPALIPHALSKKAPPNRLAPLARELLDESDERLELDNLLQLRANLLIESAAAEPPGGGPARIVGMEVTGTPEAITRLPSVPSVAQVAPGFAVRGRVAAPALVRGSAPAVPNRIDVRRETAQSLRRRLTALAEGRPVPTPELIPPEPAPDPFSSTGCIRIGDTDAIALHLPLMARFGEFTFYASPETADCTKTAEALTCRLAPRSAVRLDVGGRVGGFRVGPDPARFEVRGNGIMCGRESDPRGAS